MNGGNQAFLDKLTAYGFLSRLSLSMTFIVELSVIAWHNWHMAACMHNYNNRSTEDSIFLSSLCIGML